MYIQVMVRAFTFNSRRMRAKHTIAVIFLWGFRPKPTGGLNPEPRGTIISLRGVG